MFGGSRGPLPYHDAAANVPTLPQAPPHGAFALWATGCGLVFIRRVGAAVSAAMAVAEWRLGQPHHHSDPARVVAAIGGHAESPKRSVFLPTPAESPKRSVFLPTPKPVPPQFAPPSSSARSRPPPPHASKRSVLLRMSSRANPTHNPVADRPPPPKSKARPGSLPSLTTSRLPHPLAPHPQHTPTRRNAAGFPPGAVLRLTNELDR